MDAILFHSSSPADHQPVLSPYKSHVKTTPPNSKRGTNRPPSSIARQISDNFAPLLNFHNGFLQAPPPPPYHHLSLSYPPFSVQSQPPLLPLPISTKPIMRGLSCPPTNNRKTNNVNNIRISPKSSSLTPKKTKKTISKKDVNLKPLGPDPKYLPNNVPKISSFLSSNYNNTIDDVRSVDGIKDDEVVVGNQFSGSVAFTISPPPPSSLPLPTFSLRPKLSCNAQAAAGVDAGATDNLRRLLRLP
ncbi:hypothetical protein ACH5RR_035258 [Cinchona calisaya]|uniref:Uncharacterized protein n=1 Tax=Cinchona calisaya TaxID=153742 RepID=A0ABD2YGA9_9GENT